jgi:hypothetical protein
VVDLSRRASLQRSGDRGDLVIRYGVVRTRDGCWWTGAHPAPYAVWMPQWTATVREAWSVDAMLGAVLAALAADLPDAWIAAPLPREA